MILTPLQLLPKTVRDWGKLIVAKGLKRLPNFEKPHFYINTGYFLGNFWKQLGY